MQDLRERVTVRTTRNSLEILEHVKLMSAGYFEVLLPRKLLDESCYKQMGNVYLSVESKSLDFLILGFFYISWYLLTFKLNIPLRYTFFGHWSI